MDDETKEYRKHLVSAEQKSQEDFDKTLISLAGGALGISFAFLKDIVEETPPIEPYLLTIAWILWAVSLTAVLISFYTSHLALKKAVNQVDAGFSPKEHLGGFADSLTAFLNGLSGISFILGLIVFIRFVSLNWR